MLQYQSLMFTKAFGQLLAGAASGNPAVIARPITWDAHLVEHYPVLLNAVFATIQLLLGLGIAWRPTVRVALGASIAWSLAVWWLGEGLGGVLATPDSAVAGGPGAVILYALLAVLLWPADSAQPVDTAVRGRPRGRGPGGPGPVAGVVGEHGRAPAAAGQPCPAGHPRRHHRHGRR